MPEHEIPDWRPDWTDGDAYPNAENASSQRWAWEFLRRNPRYQSLWNKFLRPFDGAAYAADEAWRLRYPNALEFVSVGVRLGKLFGVSAADLPAPEDDSGYKWLHLDTAAVRSVGSHLVETRLRLKSNEMAFVLRLDLPLKPQIEKMARGAEICADLGEKRGEFERVNSRSHIKKYSLYLRALDANYLKITPHKIAKILLNDPDNDVSNNYKASKAINNYIAAAIKMRDYGYKYL